MDTEIKESDEYKINIDKVKSIEEKIKQLQAQKQKILSQEKEKERKQRTKRLIEMGALSETYFGKFETPLEYKNFLDNMQNKNTKKQSDENENKNLLIQIGLVSKKYFGDFKTHIEFEIFLKNNERFITMIKKSL